MRLGQGRENAKQYLRDNVTLAEEITRKILEKRGLAGSIAPTAEANGEVAEPAKPEPTRKESGRKQAASAE